MTKIEEIRQRAEAYLSTAGRILDCAEKEHRQLTEAEKRDLDGLEHKASGLKALVRTHGEIRSILDGNNKPAFGAVESAVRNPIMFGENRAYRPDELMGPVGWDGPGLGAWLRGATTGRWAPEHRALGESLAAGGGFLLPSPLSQFVIDLARSKSVVINSGAITIPMENATLDLPRLTGDPVCTWRGENQDISSGDPTFGQSRLEARSLGVMVAISNELLADSPMADGIITTSITSAMAAALDTACLMGPGTEYQPEGIISRQGVQTYSMPGDGALANYNPFVESVGMILAANGPSEGLSLVLSPRDSTALDLLHDGEDNPLVVPSLVQRMKRSVSSKLPVTLGAGKESWAVVGDFSQVAIGIRQDLLLEISREAGDAFKKNQTVVRCVVRADLTLLQPRFITVIRGIIGA